MGSVAPSLAVALTGVEGIAAVGSVGIGGNITVALTGVSATGEVGDVTASGNVLIDTHDGMMRRSRRERRIEAMRAKAEAERLADAQGLRLALEAALGMAAEIVRKPPHRRLSAL